MRSKDLRPGTVYAVRVKNWNGPGTHLEPFIVWEVTGSVAFGMGYIQPGTPGYLRPPERNYMPDNRPKSAEVDEAVAAYTLAHWQERVEWEETARENDEADLVVPALPALPQGWWTREVSNRLIEMTWHDALDVSKRQREAAAEVARKSEEEVRDRKERLNRAHGLLMQYVGDSVKTEGRPTPIKIENWSSGPRIELSLEAAEKVVEIAQREAFGRSGRDVVLSLQKVPEQVRFTKTGAPKSFAAVQQMIEEPVLLATTLLHVLTVLGYKERWEEEDFETIAHMLAAVTDRLGMVGVNTLAQTALDAWRVIAEELGFDVEGQG